ncbi:MAG: ABC transporter permease, partial [Intestinibacter sp.]
VFPKLVYSFKNTMELTLYTLIWIILMVIPMGIFAARKENGIMDRIGRAFSLIGVAIPTFVLSYIFIRIFCIKLRVLPVSGKESILHSVLPSFTLALSYAATYSRMLRNNMLSNMESRFVTYGRVRGLKESYIINKHVLRNAILPVVGSFGVSFGRLVAGSVIIENIFAWPGLGRLIVSAVLGRDYPMIQGYIVFMAILFIIANLLSDIISALVDPRIRLGSD